MSLTRRDVLGMCVVAATASAGVTSRSRVRLHRIPDNGIQPQIAMDDRGVLHMVYYTGEARSGNLFYARSSNGGANFAPSLPVNAHSGSAIAAGTIRGAQLALGRDSRVYVAWNGSGNDGPLNGDSGKPGAPMLYTRMDNSGRAFEPQRNLMHHSFGLDGGGTLCADRAGNVSVMWHGVGEHDVKSGEGEARRAVWITQSSDEGRTFDTERKAWANGTGACGCCGMKAFTTKQGRILALYRSATQSVHRDIYLLSSEDRKQFGGRILHKWEINACPMTSMDIVESANGVTGAWETSGQIYWSRLDQLGNPIAAPGEGKGRKHPRLAVNRDGDMLLVWTEGTGWQRGGSLAWQVYDKAGQPLDEPRQTAAIPAWSFGAPSANSDGSFSILY